MKCEAIEASVCEDRLDRRYRSDRPWRTLVGILGPRRRELGFAAVFFVLKHSPVWVLPVLFAHVIGILRQPALHPERDLWITLGIMAALVVQNIGTHLLHVRFLSSAVRRIERDLREALVRRLQQLSIAFHTDHESGRLQTKILRDVEAVEGLCRSMIQAGLNGFIGITFALGVTLAKEPRAALLYLVMIPIAVALRRGFHRRVRQRNRDFRAAIETMSAKVSEMIDMIPLTRAHGLEEEEIESIGGHLDGVFTRGLRVDITNALFNASAWVCFQLPHIVFLAIVGTVCYRTGSPPVEDVILYWGFFHTISNSIQMILDLYPVVARGFESVRSIGEVLECPDLEQNEGKRAVEAVIGHVVFEEVGFTYPQATRPAVRGVSLDVTPGETIALVGPSGSGKSTLIGLIIGFRRPTRGRIRLDGVDMQDLDLRTFRRHIAVIPQETVLFGGTIRDNVTYGCSEMDEAQLERALSAANVTEFLKDLPDGIQTVVGERGARLSGGQRQRIAIARALIRDPRVILMDEPTSALDSESERQVQDALRHLVQGRTTFIVAHRLSTIRHATRIVVMKDGQCVEIGSHDELMVRRGEFFHLKMLQG
jgi:ATP-binding cassette subfamily B protein